MSRSSEILVTAIAFVSLMISAAVASDPSASAVTAESSQGSFIVGGDEWERMSDEPSQQLSMARQSYVMIDLGATAKRLRKAAANLRITSNQADEAIKPQLNESAEELESLAHRVEKGEIKSVNELDQPSARALHRLSRHHYLMAQRLWLQKRRERAGRQLRAAADNLEHAASLGEQEVETATQTVVKDVRMISAKLVEGVGYGVDEVGKGFERLGKEVESVGDGIEPNQKTILRDN